MYRANSLIGVELVYVNDCNVAARIKGTSIAISVEDGEPTEMAIDSSGATHHLKTYGGGEGDGGRLYYGHLVDYDDEYGFAPVGVSLAVINTAMDAVRAGLEGLGYGGEVRMFCFLSCH